MSGNNDNYCSKWKNEFQMQNCYLQLDPTEDLVRSQWQTRSKSSYYLTYRWILGLFYAGSLIYSIVSFAWMGGLYFIYLTNWGMMLCTAVQIYATILVTYWHLQTDYLRKVNQLKEMPVSFKIYWWFHNTALTTSIVITIIYWSVLHPFGMFELSAANILTHGTNSLGMFIDVLVVAYPTRLYHIVQPVTFGLVYVIFSVIYFFAGGVDFLGNTFIYPVLDWNNPGFAFITVFGVLLIETIIQIILILIYHLRTNIYWKYFGVEFTLPTTARKTETVDSNVSLPD